MFRLHPPKEPTMADIVKSPRSILRLPAVKTRSGLARSTIYDRMKEGRFPKARRIAGSNIVGWDSQEIDAWIAEQLEVRA